MPDITHLSVEELKRLQAEAESLIASKKDQEIEDAYQQILAVAEKVGVTAEQLPAVGASDRRKSSRTSVEPRYRSKSNPDDTWTGRGKQPRWLVAELEKGAKLDDFLI